MSSQNSLPIAIWRRHMAFYQLTFVHPTREWILTSTWKNLIRQELSLTTADNDWTKNQMNEGGEKTSKGQRRWREGWEEEVEWVEILPLWRNIVKKEDDLRNETASDNSRRRKEGQKKCERKGRWHFQLCRGGKAKRHAELTECNLRKADMRRNRGKI